MIVEPDRLQGLMTAVATGCGSRPLPRDNNRSICLRSLLPCVLWFSPVEEFIHCLFVKMERGKVDFKVYPSSILDFEWHSEVESMAHSTEELGRTDLPIGAPHHPRIMFMIATPTLFGQF